MTSFLTALIFSSLCLYVCRGCGQDGWYASVKVCYSGFKRIKESVEKGDMPASELCGATEVVIRCLKDGLAVCNLSQDEYETSFDNIRRSNCEEEASRTFVKRRGPCDPDGLCDEVLKGYSESSEICSVLDDFETCAVGKRAECGEQIEATIEMYLKNVQSARTRSGCEATTQLVKRTESCDPDGLCKEVVMDHPKSSEFCSVIDDFETCVVGKRAECGQQIEATIERYLKNIPPIRTRFGCEATNQLGKRESPPETALNPRPSIVTANIGDTATLKCSVSNLGTRTVIWRRQSDSLIISLGSYTIVSNNRFVASHNPARGEWNLSIRDVQPEDSGVYICQVNTREILTQHTTLRVNDPSQLDGRMLEDV